MYEENGRIGCKWDKKNGKLWMMIISHAFLIEDNEAVIIPDGRCRLLQIQLELEFRPAIPISFISKFNLTSSGCMMAEFNEIYIYFDFTSMLFHVFVDISNNEWKDIHIYLNWWPTNWLFSLRILRISQLQQISIGQSIPNHAAISIFIVKKNLFWLFASSIKWKLFLIYSFISNWISIVNSFDTNFSNPFFSIWFDFKEDAMVDWWNELYIILLAFACFACFFIKFKYVLLK